MRELYPPIQPYNQGNIKVSDIHTIYFEECGNPQGKPAVFLHGGPGGGSIAAYRQFFHPDKWRVVLFDQRGCGRSTPHAELEENTTWNLVKDIETIRQHLGIDSWVVVGGSWGSTLALAYSQTHPDRCQGLILRGIFMVRPKEIRWFYQEGTSYIFPDAWEEYLKPIPEAERHDMVAAYYRRLTSADRAIRLEAARAWSIWEGSTSKLIPDTQSIQRFGQDYFAEAFARIECHYFVNNCFLEHPEQLVQNVKRISHLPGVIVHGRYDVVCPLTSAWELHRAWPKSELHIIPDAGHSMFEPGILSAIIEATDKFAAM
ncbi:MAG TPA: prolyl aminopeptidase [Oscillatoriaceae cyanobacterium M33_DOE_052]|uniref:Proline iminopeptidase n=1 Tax=Planktothricoides sp. SpSt-374 TaxID=2282167 RepID=A0A7C3VK44_9CYAN|nr:prolyl aminopeptidase [Oscillatoriaceae cyanobacterium M33_DOE_052]